MAEEDAGQHGKHRRLQLREKNWNEYLFWIIHHVYTLLRGWLHSFHRRTTTFKYKEFSKLIHYQQIETKYPPIVLDILRDSIQLETH